MTKGEWQMLMAGLILGAGFMLLALMAGCADRRPSCYDNPRNMACMTADELQRELNP